MDQAEQLRKLVRQRERAENVARVITVTSGKGGVGKSTTVVNLAVQLGRLGERVVIFDADFGLANIEVMLGIRPKYNLADLMFGGKELQDIIAHGIENVKFISGGSGIRELTNLTKDQIVFLTQKLRELDNLVDIIMIDTGAGIADSVLDFVMASTEVLLIATPEPTSITDAYALLKKLSQNDGFSTENTSIRLLANSITSETEGIEIRDKLSIVANKFLKLNLEYLGAVPNDPNVSRSIIYQKPISISYPNSTAVKAYIELAERLCYNIDTIPKGRKGLASLFTSLLRYRYKSKRK